MPSDEEKAPLDLLNASLQEMTLLSGIGERTAQKIISLRETGIKVTMSRIKELPNLNAAVLEDYIKNGQIAPLPELEEETILFVTLIFSIMFQVHRMQN